MPRSKTSRLLLILLLLLFFASSVAKTPLPRTSLIVKPKYEDEKHSHSGAVELHHGVKNLTTLTKKVSFLPVVYVAVINSVINVLRPDAAIIWQARVPRVLWEVCIAIVAKSASTSNPSTCLLLCLMTVPTALIDIFVWAPSFAMFANFETCTGGGIFSRQPKVCTSDYQKGIGRLFVSLTNLLFAVACWHIM